jgi:hypothetical protein
VPTRRIFAACCADAARSGSKGVPATAPATPQINSRRCTDDPLASDGRNYRAGDLRKSEISRYRYTIHVAEAGGLMAYDVDYPDLERRAATYVDRILKGAKPSDLPVQQPTKFALVINLKTARALGLTISEPFLLRAEQIIE